MSALRSGTLQRRAADGTALDLRYVEGPGSGPVMLFQHGLCGSADQTAEVFPGDAQARLLTLECRGHGQSPAGPAAELSIATFTDDVRALLAHAARGPVIVGGISMGAAIALRLAVHHPELVSGLVLARPAWSWQAAPPNMLPNLEVGRLLAAQLPAGQACQRFLAGDTARRLARDAPDNLASLQGFFDRRPLAVTRDLLCRISVDGPGVSEQQVAALSVPVLVIGTAQDDIHPIDLARALAACAPQGEFIEVTPKALDRSAYVAGMQAAIRSLIARIPSP